MYRRSTVRGNYEVLYSTFNYSGVYNGPTSDVIVTVDYAYMVKEMTTYHWNNGSGKTPGSISIYKDGVSDGTWTAAGRDGSGASNVLWDVFPDYVMEPGHTYKIVDSDNSTWSYNSGSGGRGFVEICGYAAEESVFGQTGLFAINISDAGAAQIDTWASSGFGKGNVMFPVMSLEPQDWEEPVEYFFRASDMPTMHMLTLYGGKHIEENKIQISGVRTAGNFTETVYGEGEETLYCYTVPILVHASDCTISINVDGKKLIEFPCTHIPPEAPKPYVTALYADEYTENGEGYLSSFTVKISGFSLPTDKALYKFQRMIDTEPYYNTDFAECTDVSEKDDYGMFTLTFELKENLGVYDLQWLDLLIDDSISYFFGKGDHLTANYNGVYSFNGNEQGSNARIVSPYYAASGGNVSVKSPAFSVPQAAVATPITVGVTPNSYEDGKIAYSTDGGSTWSKWAKIGTSLSVPLINGNGEYGLIFKFKKDGLDEKQSDTYIVTLAVPDKDPETIPYVTLPAKTTTRTVTANVSYGSYSGGEMAWSIDGGKTFTNFTAVSSKATVTLPDAYGIYPVAFAFRKSGYKPYQTNIAEIDYNDGMAAAPASGGIIDAETNKAVQKKGDAYIISGDKNSLYRLYADYKSGETLEAVFKKTDGTSAFTKALTYNKERARYETEITPPQVYMSDSFAKATFTAEIPLSKSNDTAFQLKLKYGGQWDGTNSKEQNFTYSERVPMFTVINPGDIYIADQLIAQGLDRADDEQQATWKLNLALRAYSTDNPEENIITIYDNGVEVKKFAVSKGRTGTGFTYGYLVKEQVELTDNLKAGIHVVWAERTLDGETIATQPVAFTLLEGSNGSQVYVSDLEWTHWNHRIGWSEDTPDRMYFKNLSDMAGENIWVWPGKRHDMQFRINNATSKELEHVYLTYTTLVDKGYYVYDTKGNLLEGYSKYVPVTQKIECRKIEENFNSNYSIWGFENKDLGYLQDFEFEFEYNAALDKDTSQMSAEELDLLEAEGFYKANGLGELPDSDALAEQVAELSDEDMLDCIESMSETSQVFKGLDIQVTEDTDKSFKMELKTPTDEISEYTVTMKESGTMELPDIWMLMESERENGNQNPDEEGWDVTWSEFDTKQGSIVLRIATFEGEDETGRPAILSHSTYYITKSVADKLFETTNSSSSPMLMSAAVAPMLRASAASTVPNDAEYFDKPDHWTKTAYDYSSYLYGSADIGYSGLKSLVWFDQQFPNKFVKSEVAEKFLQWGDKNKYASGASNAFKVLGVADTVYTFAKGPSGNDPSDLRALLSLIKDDKSRQSLERQIKDYEEMRDSIYKQDCTMSTISTASGFVPGLGIIGKVVTFIGGIGNSLLSSGAKEANKQVYNSTLHDIQLQIQIERRRAEVYNASLAEAQQWMRDRMDRIYGKGNWSEYRLAEEQKYWVLVTFPNGTVKYVWHEKVPKFNVVLDPSGFVYEAVEDNPVEGVTATLYYSDEEDGNYSVWMDSADEQPNPQITSDEGRYSWMVPAGFWKVLYEKEGYLPAETKPMRVPPIHTAVNIGLLSTIAPKAAVSADNKNITVLFSNYMQLESLVRLFGDETYEGSSFDASSFTVQFYDADGVAVPGTVTFPDKTANAGYIGSVYSRDVIDSEWFVRTAIFTPYDNKLDLSGATWTFADGMVSYSGVELDKTGSAENLYLVTLDAGKGTLSIPSLITNDKGKLSKLPSPIYDGYSFDGWYTAESGGEKVTTDTVFDANTTIYAHYTKESTGGSLGRTHGGNGVSLVKHEETTAETDEKTTNPFVDVKSSDYFYDAVLWAVKENITNGTSDTTFSPLNSCAHRWLRSSGVRKVRLSRKQRKIRLLT